MRKFSFKKIDAFATIQSAGNPAGYVSIDTAIKPVEMQKIAKELSGNTFALKFYSETREVDFCGHATVAILYDLIKNRPALAGFDLVTIQINTRRVGGGKPGGIRGCGIYLVALP